MPQNGILHEGIAALAEAFKSNPNLKVCRMASQLMLSRHWVWGYSRQSGGVFEWGVQFLLFENLSSIFSPLSQFMVMNLRR